MPRLSTVNARAKLAVFLRTHLFTTSVTPYQVAKASKGQFRACDAYGCLAGRRTFNVEAWKFLRSLLIRYRGQAVADEATALWKATAAPVGRIATKQELTSEAVKSELIRINGLATVEAIRVELALLASRL